MSGRVTGDSDVTKTGNLVSCSFRGKLKAVKKGDLWLICEEGAMDFSVVLRSLLVLELEEKAE